MVTWVSESLYYFLQRGSYLHICSHIIVKIKWKIAVEIFIMHVAFNNFNYSRVGRKTQDKQRNDRLSVQFCERVKRINPCFAWFKHVYGSIIGSLGHSKFAVTLQQITHHYHVDADKYSFPCRIPWPTLGWWIYIRRFFNSPARN